MMIPISLQDQILPGTFKYTLNTVIDELDFSCFDQRYINDEVDAPTYDPAIVLKIILYAYSRGIDSSQSIALLITQQIICIVLAAEEWRNFVACAEMKITFPPIP